jgi:hypothetical protein
MLRAFILTAALLGATALPATAQERMTPIPNQNAVAGSWSNMADGGYFRRLYDFDYDQLCTFHAGNTRAGGVACQSFTQLTPAAQARFTTVCRAHSRTPDACPTGRD